MKLATLRTTDRDGQLLVVSRDLKRATAVPSIAANLQQAIDNWQQFAPSLHAVYLTLNKDESIGFALDPTMLHAPLPRAYQWADGSAYLNHVELVRKSRGAEMPENLWHDPLMYQGGSDNFLGPREAIPLIDETWGLDFEAEVAVIVQDVAMGANQQQAKQAISLILLVNDISLRNLIPAELSKGFGFFQSKPSTAFSPVAVTPDELGEHWDGARLHLPLLSHLNRELFGNPNAGVGMHFDFPALIAHAAKTRPLAAGSIVGSGTVSNADRSVGSSCIAERRMLETLADGVASTPYLKIGDEIRIEMLDKEGASIFGAIEQQVYPYQGPTHASA